MLRQKILDIIPSCCNIGFVQIHNCSKEEQSLILDVFPSTKTIVVLTHHVKTSLEWTWFPLESERCNVTCGADLHAKNVLDKIGLLLKQVGFSSCLLPYPGRCGIRMKDLANKTGLGQTGDNFLFLHSKWGPWTHLRLLFTDAIVMNDSTNKSEVCTHCGKCMASCPVKAIKIDRFEGITCEEYQTPLGFLHLLIYHIFNAIVHIFPLFLS